MWKCTCYFVRCLTLPCSSRPFLCLPPLLPSLPSFLALSLQMGPCSVPWFPSLSGQTLSHSRTVLIFPSSSSSSGTPVGPSRLPGCLAVSSWCFLPLAQGRTRCPLPVLRAARWRKCPRRAAPCFIPVMAPVSRTSLTRRPDGCRAQTGLVIPNRGLPAEFAWVCSCLVSGLLPVVDGVLVYSVWGSRSSLTKPLPSEADSGGVQRTALEPDGCLIPGSAAHKTCDLGGIIYPPCVLVCSSVERE